MSLINNENTVDNELIRQKKELTAMYRNLKNAYVGIFNDIWRNPNFTSKQIVEGYGTDAQILFGASAKTAELLTMVDPDFVPPTIPEGISFVVNADGSVTVTEAP